MPKSKPPIVLLTDFGYRDHYVGVMKGVIAKITPFTPLIDLTHGVPAQHVAAGALLLGQSWRFFPSDTIFLGVVDPGVGTARVPIAITTRAGPRFVGPDNGLLAIAAEAAGIAIAVKLESAKYRLPQTSSTFHGRDIFAPAAAWLARGIAIKALGPRVSSIVSIDPLAGVRRVQRTVVGHVIYVDSFGNLVTNLTRDTVEQFAGRDRAGRLAVKLGRHRELRLGSTYGDAPVGKPLALFGSFELLEIGVRDGDAAAYFGVGAGTAVTVRIKKQGWKIPRSGE